MVSKSSPIKISIIWLGEENGSDQTEVRSTGGGFGLPAIPGHIIFLVQTQQKLAAQGKAVSVAFLEYSKPLNLQASREHLTLRTEYDRLDSGEQIPNSACSGRSSPQPYHSIRSKSFGCKDFV